ncbi:MAG: DNA polymerase III subunit beta [Deltaproteobacteria bacterium]|nr:DNA polymerase III subunit beta [Deltaproteobacteria bacterium]
MKFTIQKGDILDVLSKIQGLTSRKSNLAITENILIKASDAGITLMATDLETGLEGYYPAKVEKPGSIAISARKFFEIVREFPSDNIDVNEVDNRWIEIGNKSIQYNIVGMDPDDFPDNPNIDDVVFFEVESAPLKKMIEKSIIISGGSDDKRAHINGAMFEKIDDTEKKIVRIVSTDGSRLSKCDQVLEKNVDLPEMDKIIIPKKGLNEVAKFLSSEGVVSIGIMNNYFIVKKDAEIIIIRLLEGEFPEYTDIIKKDDAYNIIIDRNRITMLLKRMSILSSENYKGAVFDFNDNRLLVSATNPEIGESKEDMEIEFDRERINVAFNPKYIIEILNAIEGEKVVLNIHSEEKPCIIEGVDDKSYLSVIMPMRI